jgi:hypothetical protein
MAFILERSTERLSMSNEVRAPMAVRLDQRQRRR